MLKYRDIDIASNEYPVTYTVNSTVMVDDSTTFNIKSGFTSAGKAVKGYWIQTKDSKGHKVYVNSFPFTFDIETTTMEVNGRHPAFMYTWQCIYGDTLYIGRRWSTFMKLYEAIVKASGCGDKRRQVNRNGQLKYETTKYRLFCLDHNFSYEWQYIRKRFTFKKDSSDFFSMSDRDVVKGTTAQGVVFIDTLHLTNLALKSVTKQYGLNTKKMVGDLDYKVIRNSLTTLSKTDLGYCANDVKILAELWDKIVKAYINNGVKIPMTATSVLRSDVKQDAKEWITMTVKGKTVIDTQRQNDIIALFPKTAKEYDIDMHLTYRGGFTHGNLIFGNTHLKSINVNGIFGYDFTSSYPAVMFHHISFPVTPFTPDANINGVFDKYSDCAFYEFGRSNDGSHKCAIGKFTFYGLKARKGMCIESASKCVEYNAVNGNLKEFRALTGAILDNGRISEADCVTVYLTEQDFYLYSLYYDFEFFELEEAKTAQGGPLPDYILKGLLFYYQKKQDLKRQHLDKTPAYKYAKSMVNAFYGMLVEKLHFNPYTLDENGEIVIDNKYEGMSDDERYMNVLFGESYNKVISGERLTPKVLSPYWGIYVTAVARRNLLEFIASVDINEAIYCDTDSVYFINHYSKRWAIAAAKWNDTQARINLERVNNWNKRHPEQAIDYDNFKDLGGFDPICEEITDFKYLGAKRYLKRFLEDGEYTLEFTVAGCPKEKALSAAKRAVKEGTVNSEFDFFTDGMVVPSCKRARDYVDSHVEAYVTDEEGNTEVMVEEASIGLYDIDFSLKLDGGLFELWQQYDAIKREVINYENIRRI